MGLLSALLGGNSRRRGYGGFGSRRGYSSATAAAAPRRAASSAARWVAWRSAAWPPTGRAASWRAAARSRPRVRPPTSDRCTRSARGGPSPRSLRARVQGLPLTGGLTAPWRRRSTCWRSTRAPPARTSPSSTPGCGWWASAYREFTQHFPKPGWVEHDLEEIWALASSGASREALTRRGPQGHGHRRDRHHQPARDDAACGTASTRQAAAPRHRLAGPAHRGRSAPSSRRAGDEPRVRETTGLVLDPYFSGTKLRWLLDHVKGARAQRRARASCASAPSTPGSSAGSPAARAHVTDVSNASRTLLMDLRTLRVGRRAAARCFGVPRARACRRSAARAEVYGTTRGHEGAARRHPDRGHGRRPAGGALRPGLLRRPARPSAPTAPARSC